jgi:hypothetical protein
VTKLVEFTWYIIHFRKFYRQQQCTLQLVWGQHRAYQLIRRLWRCEAFFTAQSQRPTDASHRLTCGKEGQLQSAEWNSCIPETVHNRTHTYTNFAQNDQYCDLREYWPFLLGYTAHPHLFLKGYVSKTGSVSRLGTKRSKLKYWSLTWSRQQFLNKPFKE